MKSPQETVQGLGNVLVIGGCGLLGHHIVKFLVENGKPANEIAVFDITVKHNRFDDINYIAGDLSQKDVVSAAFKQTNPNVIINVASPDAMTPDKSVFARCNIVGVKNIIECAQKQGIRVLVHSSSSEVIQDSYHDMIWATEEWSVQANPVNGSIYAKTKAVGEGLVLAANRQQGILTTAIRLCTLLGEGDRVLTRHFMELGRKGTIKFQVGHGKNLYDFIYAGNAAEGHLLAAKIPMELVCFFMAIWEVVYWVFTFGGEPEVKARMLRYTQQVRTFDITKARERLGYEPRVTLEDGFRRGVNWHIKQDKQKAKSL
ncbi:hypothetical protein N0V90_009574 [Kalmusia sp. IMI 367209]|nr:hypothetical protein N0V90_009574 [Kalmusia sp. IMI 367209]